MEHPITNLCKNRVISEKGQPMLCRRTTVQWLRRENKWSDVSLLLKYFKAKYFGGFKRAVTKYSFGTLEC